MYTMYTLYGHERGTMEIENLSTTEVADRLDVHRNTVISWIRKGYFPNARKVGLGKNSPYVIPESDVTEFEEMRDQSTK